MHMKITNIAMPRGVRCCQVFAQFSFAPYLMSSKSVGTWFSIAARCNGVLPDWSAALKFAPAK
jgi:hypothetical protein